MPRADRSSESCTGQTALTHDRNAHLKLIGTTWGKFGSYEGYLREMVPKIGARAVAEALNIGEGTVRRDCVRIGVQARRGRGAPGMAKTRT